MRTIVAILAGGKTDRETRKITGIEDKALLRYGNKSLFSIAYQACLDAKRIYLWNHLDVEVYGSKKIENCIKRTCTDVVFFKTTDDHKLFDVVEKVLDGKQDEDFIIFMSSDLPFIGGKNLSRLLFQVAQKDGIMYPIIEENYIPSVYRELQTFRKTNKGYFTGGNVISGKVKYFRKGLQFTRKLLENRKNPLKMASQFGFTMLISVFLGIWSPERISKEVLNRTGVLIVPLYSRDYGLSVDIDSFEDFKAILETKTKATP